LTQKETAAIVGVHPRMVSDWFERYGAENMRGERFCIHCGQSLAGTDMKRKYCSQACENKVNYARQHPEGRSRMEFDPVLREKGLKLYWGGLDQHAISRQLGVAEGTVGCWIHRYGGLRERRKIPEVMAMRPFKRRLKEAKDVDEWTQILSEAVRAGPSGSAIQLVCGTVSGQCEISHYAAMIADVLKLDPCSGEMFAFCNKSGKSISVIQWRHGAFRLVRIPKRRGCYLWPGEEMGKCGVVFMNEFNYLLQYEKNHARKLKKVEK
jgi:transposase-like protein